MVYPNLSKFTKQADIIAALNNTFKYLDHQLNMNHIYFDNILSQIIVQRFNLIKSIPLIPKSRFWVLHLPISTDIVCTKIYDKRDELVFETVNFPFLRNCQFPVFKMLMFLTLL